MCQQEKLQSVTLESSELSSDLNKKKQMLEKIEEELQHAEEVCQWGVQKLKSNVAAYSNVVP